MPSKPADTAIVMIVGPCIDDTDFKSLEEAITYNAAGMDVSLIVEKTDGTSAVTAIILTSGGTSDWTHKDGGYYEVEITAAQNAEEGVAYVRGVCTGVLPFESVHYDIVKANVYDSLIKGTDVLHADVTQWLGTAAATPTVAGVPEVDITYCGGSAVAAGAIPNAAADAAGGLPISDAGGLDLDTKLANTNEVTSARMGALTDWINGGRLDNLLDAIPTTAMRGTDNATLAATWTDARAGYLDNLSAGAVALAAGVDLTSIHGAALTETVNGYLAAAFTKLFDVATPLLVASDVMRGTDGANTTVPDAAGTLATYDPPTNTEMVAAFTEIKGATWAAGTDTLEAIRNQGDAAWVTATGFNTTVPDAAGTAAGLHATTDGKIDTLQTDSTAIKAKTDNLPSGLAKNVALAGFNVYMVLSSDHVTAATGKTLTGTISKDGAAFSALTNAISEIANGLYKVDLTQAEMNADVVTLKFTETDCDQRIITIYTS